jgi:hypothetical protein
VQDQSLVSSYSLSARRARQILENFLVAEGWKPEVVRSRGQGFSIEARYGTNRWIVQLAFMNPSKQQVVDAFSSVLGEILRRMKDPVCRYSIALPDSDAFRRLWDRLPDLSKDRLNLTALFISPSGVVLEKAS